MTRGISEARWILVLLGVLWLGACGREGGGVDIGGVTLKDVGTAGLSDIQQDVGGGGSGERDSSAVDLSQTDALLPPPRDIGPPPDISTSLAPNCPADDVPWSLYFSKSVLPSADPGGTASCGDVRLDRVMAWWIESADRSVDIAIYSQDAKVIADALMGAHEAGVEVRVIIDDDNGPDAPGSRIQELEDAGIAVRIDNQDGPLMHEKFIVLDGETVLLGSANAGTYDAVANANNVLVIPSPDLASVYAEEFQGLWEGGFHDDKGGAHRLSLDAHAASIWFSPSQGLEDELIHLIDGAQHEIYVAMFAFTRQRLADAILDRCGDVDIIVVMDEGTRDNPYTVDLSGCQSAQILLDHVQPSGGLSYPLTLHHKYMIIDGRAPSTSSVVVTGSMNWSHAGLFDSDEDTLVWHHPDVARRYVQEFAARVEEAGGSL